MNSTSSRPSATQTAGPLARFLESYEANISRGDMTAVVDQFADVFIAAGPQGAQCVRSSDFALALPKKKQLFDTLGRRSTSLVSCVETRLDARFAMAESRWKLTFVREGEKPSEVLADSLFIVETAPEGAKIVFYLAHQDLMAVLRDQGVLPA